VSQDFESYDEIKDEWEDVEEENQPVTETKEELYTSEEMKDIKKEINDLKEFQHLARSITRNSKGEVLLIALKKGFAEIERLGGNKKAIIFTESTRTQEYLNRILENTEHKDRIVLFKGLGNYCYTVFVCRGEANAFPASPVSLVPLPTRAKHDEAVLSPLRGILIFSKSLTAQTTTRNPKKSIKYGLRSILTQTEPQAQKPLI